MDGSAPIGPLSDEELAAIPVFPLPRAVLFPGSVLPLHLFEPRYRDMMEHCTGDGPRAMVIALLEPGFEDDYQGRPPIHQIACAGRILEHRRHPDGRFDLLLQGTHRVRVSELPEEGLSFRRAQATVLSDRIPHLDAVERQVPSLMATASTVVSRIRVRFPEFTLGIDADTAPSQLADRIADRLVSEPESRQRLLEALDVKVRLALVLDELLELLVNLPSGTELH